MLLVISLPRIGLWASMLRISYRLLFPAIVLFCCIGNHGIAISLFNAWLTPGQAGARVREPPSVTTGRRTPWPCSTVMWLLAGIKP